MDLKNQTNQALIQNMIQQGFETPIPKKNALPPGYCMNEQGLYKIIEKTAPEETLWICDPFHIEGISRDSDQMNWGWYLSFFNLDGNKIYVHVPQLLVEEGQNLRKLLRSYGLRISTGGEKKYLNEFLAAFNTERRVRLVSKFGWHHSVYVLPDEMFGTHLNEVYCPFETTNHHGFSQQGTIEEWKSHVGKYCIGNSRLIFSVSTAFAAPLLDLLGIEGGGVHLEGISSIGKSIILIVASSAVGDPKTYIFTWRTTDNALESTCLMRNDSLLVLDEIGEMDPRRLGETAYMIANGSGKKRAYRDGEGMTSKKWRTLLLSNGEKTLSNHIVDGGKIVKAGQEVRIITIPAEVSLHGAFENIHPFQSSREFAETLERNAKHYFGTPIRHFLKILTSAPLTYKTCAKEYFKKMNDLLNPYVTNPQISRIAKRFSLIATGGMLASEFGCTGWEISDVKEAVLKCFSDWLEEWGEETAEEKAFCEHVQGFFQRYSGSRFIPKNADDVESRSVKDLAGYIYDDSQGRRTFLVNRDVFKKEICKGIREQKAKEILFRKNWLLKSAKGWQVSYHIPHLGSTDWFYELLPPVDKE